MVTSYVPRRADVVWLTFELKAGHEQAGRRPALVVSPEAYNNKVGLALVCPITNQAKGYPFEVTIPAGLDVRGVVLADQLKSLDWRVRAAEYLARVPSEVMGEVIGKLGVLISAE